MIPRKVRLEDLPRVLELNERALPHVNSIRLEDMRWFLENAPYFRLTESKRGKIAGFLIALTPGLDYGSENYRWFSETFDAFYYIDRVVVDETVRGQGIGKVLYQDVIKRARALAPRLTCEVNSRPPNPGSMAFHASFGFREIGVQETEGGKKEVSLMSLDLD